MENLQPHLPFKTSTFTLTHESGTCTFLLPADPDAVIDTVPEAAFEKDRFLPYWAEHWPSASPFFSYLMSAQLHQSTRALELGCGLGVLTTALSVKQLFTVALDISPESCLFAAHNIRQSGEASRVLSADWRALPFTCRFDLVVASDVLYEERWIEVILDTLDTLLTSKGKALIADPCRRYWEPFKKAALKRGYTLRTVHTSTVNQGGTTVEIIELGR